MTFKSFRTSLLKKKVFVHLLIQQLKNENLKRK
jgi:hypothetical protein